MGSGAHLRRVCVPVLASATIAMLAVTAVLLWRTLQLHLALQRFSESVVLENSAQFEQQLGTVMKFDQGQSAVPLLIAYLDHSDERVRARATLALGHIGANSREALPRLHRSLSEEGGLIRLFAVETLCKIDPTSIDPTQTLIDAARNEKESVVRQRAAYDLGRIADRRRAVAALIEVMEDEDAAVRRQGAEALGKIGPDAKAAVPTLVEALKDQDFFVRDMAAYVLRQIEREPAVETDLHGK